MRADARDIARMVSIPQMLLHLGWRLRPRNRADCGLCRGSSKETLAYREHVWHCHRCHAGGSVYDLVMQAQQCDFRSALAYVADLAGVKLDDHRQHGKDWRHEMAERERQRERIDGAAEKLARMERELRLECRE